MTLSTVTLNKNPLVPASGNKSTLSRLRLFADWQAEMGHQWYKPNLGGYRAYLFAHGKSASTVSVYLSAVRSRYRELIADRDLFYRLLPTGAGISPADYKAMVDELIQRIENAIDPSLTRVNRPVVQDVTDSAHTWLTRKEAADLLAQPSHAYGADTIPAARDYALLALALGTGLREAELSALNIGDLYQTMAGQPCVIVRHGKGNKQRAVPYGAMATWLMPAIEVWLSMYGQRGENQPVFISFYNGWRKVRGRLSERRIGEIVRSYWIKRDGNYISVAPHDLRRTYARWLYQTGMALPAIAENMGHTKTDVTKKYIGPVDIDDRLPAEELGSLW